MTNQFSPCACIGPVGACPCVLRSQGIEPKITETFISPDLFDLLPDEDKETINKIKHKALGLFISSKHKA